MPLTPLHFRALQDLNTQGCPMESYKSLVQLNHEAQEDHYWWATQFPLHYSTVIMKVEVSIMIESDTSKSGWGAV